MVVTDVGGGSEDVAPQQDGREMNGEADDPHQADRTGSQPLALPHPVAERVVDGPPAVDGDEEDAEQRHVQQRASQCQVQATSKTVQCPPLLHLSTGSEHVRKVAIVTTLR